MTEDADATRLLWAVKSKNKNEILQALSKVSHEDLKVPDRDGNTLLHLVITNDILSKTEIIEFLELLLDRGSDIYAQNKHGKTTLHRAIQWRMKRVVDFLISRKCDINRQDEDGNSIAHDFIEEETVWFYNTLERRKSRFQRMDSVVVEGESVKFLVKAYERDREAQESESARFTEFLIEKGLNFDLQNDQGTSALHLAIKRNLLHVLHVLLKHTRDIHFADCRRKSLLQMFIEEQTACRDSRKKSRRDWYPKYASRYTANIVNLLLDRGVSTWPGDNDRGFTSLQTAIDCKVDTSIIKTLIDHGLKSMEQYSATQMFAELFKIYLWWDVSKSKHFLSGFRGLVSQGANVNAEDENGITPLYHAFYRSNASAVHCLIDLGADLSLTTNFNENPFHALARAGVSDKATNDTSALEELFDLVASRGCCDVNARNSSNETPLHWAARCDNLAIARKLIDGAAEVDCKDANGCTPLHHAVFHSKSEGATRLLLESGANANSKDYWGRRLLPVAVDVADKLVPLLLKWGAYVNDAPALPFWKVISRDNYSIAKVMLVYGADINNNDASVRSFFNCSRSDTTGISICKATQRKRFLLQHWAKLKAANFPCSKEYDFHAKDSDCQKACRDCAKEIEQLKKTFINKRTSVYGFLHMDFGRRRGQMNNEKLRQLVESAELEEQFPNYSVVIRASYYETVTWTSLLEPAKQTWLQITGIRLPDECLEFIFAHLSNADLVNMIELDEHA